MEKIGFNSDTSSAYNRRLLFILFLVELLILSLGITFPIKVTLLLVAVLAGGFFLFLLPAWPAILFPAMVVTTALDISGQISEDSRFFTALDTPITAFHLAGGAAIIFCVANLLLKKRMVFPRLKLTIPLMAFLSVIGLSVLYTPQRLQATVDFFRMMFLASLIFVTAVLVENRRVVTLVIVSIILCAVAAAGLGILQVATERYFLPASFVQAVGARIPRAAGTFHNPNTFATFLMVAIVLSFTLLINLKLSWLKMVALMVSLVTLLGGLLVTFSRANWLSTGVGILLVTLFSRRLKMLLQIALILLCILVVIGFISSNLRDLIFVRFTSIFTTFSELKSGARISAASRVHYVKAAISMFLDHPLVGIGTRGYPVFFDKYKPAEFPIWYPIKECHTYLAVVLAELGIVGLGIFLWLIIVILKAGIAAVMTIGDEYLKAVEIGLVSVFIAFQVSMFFTADIGNNIFWIMIGMLFAVKQMGEKAQAE